MLNSSARIVSAPFGDVIEYDVVLGQQADGKIHVAVTATTVDEVEPQLLNREIFRDCAATIDDALAVVRASIIGSRKS